MRNSKSRDNSDLDNIPYLDRPIYKDINTSKDTLIKIPVSKDVSKDPQNYKYDYKSLRNILRIEMDKPITIKQAKVIGDSLIELYQSLYFEDL